MDHIGMDIHKMESQICILTEAGERTERWVGTEPERFAAVLRDRHSVGGLHRQQMGGSLPVADPNFAPMCATRTRYISVIRALLRQHGYRVPSEQEGTKEATYGVSARPA